MSFAQLMRSAKAQSAQSHASLQEKIKDEQQKKLEEQQRRAEQQARQAEKLAALQKLEAERETLAREKDAQRLKEIADRKAARLEQAEQPPTKKRKLSDSPPPRSRSVSSVKKQHRAASPSVTDPRLSHKVDRATLNAAMSHTQLQKKNTFDPYAIVELTPSENKRDLRTIDEIEREMHKDEWGKRDLPVSGAEFFHKAPAAIKTGQGISKTQSAAQVLPNGQLLPPSRRNSSNSRPPSPKEKRSVKPKSSWQIPKKIVAEAKKPGPTVPSVKAEGSSRSSMAEESTEDYRNEIWKMFGKNRSAYTAKDYDSDESDMEGGASDLLREEEEAARLARREDQREERLLAQRKREKEERKAARQ